MNKPEAEQPNDPEKRDVPETRATPLSPLDANIDSEGLSFPTAVVGPRRSVPHLFQGSMLWLLTLACMLLAIGLVWWSLPPRGIEIVVHFPEGHGLEAEDAVRFRGIDVGHVEKVSLNPELDAVDVTIHLKPFAEPLAREGTRFWIVRPELSISGISGLETAVGHKYVGLIPGERDGAFQRVFRGLDDSPPEALAEDGIELIFRGEKRHSISAGSPVTFRGVEIGRILTVGLSSDSRYVDARARIFEDYKQLITTDTVVWATSGVNLDFKFGQGLVLNTESLETIARGGVSLLTIRNGGKSVQSGHVMTLNAKPELSWFEAANNVRATNIELRGAIPLRMQWVNSSRILGGQKDRTISGVPIVNSSGETFLILPGDVFETPSRYKEGTLTIAPVNSNEMVVSIEPDAEKEAQTLVKLKVPKEFCSNWLAAPKDFRQREEGEESVAVRGSMPGSASSVFVHYPIDAENVDEDGKLLTFTEDEDLWHGTPLLSNLDGKVVGVLSITGRGQARILAIDPELLR